MFDIGWSEMAVIMLVALIVIGPKDLPRVARTVGRWVAKGRALAREFQSSLEEMAREAELDKVKQEIERAGRGDIGKSIEKSIDPTGELSKAFDPSTSSGGRTAAANGGAGQAAAASSSKLKGPSGSKPKEPSGPKAKELSGSTVNETAGSKPTEPIGAAAPEPAEAPVPAPRVRESLPADSS